MDPREQLREAETHLRAGRAAEAQRICASVLSRERDHPLALHYLGIIAFHTGNSQQSVELLHRAAQREPANAVYWLALGQVLSLTHRYPEALTAIERAVALAPDDASLRYMLGSLASELGRIDQAIENLRCAVRLKPDMAVAYNNLGLALCRTRDVAEGLVCFEKAESLDPTSVTPANNRVYFAHFDARADGAAIRRMAEAWAARWAEPLTRAAPAHDRRAAEDLAEDLSPARRLRVGYVSPDLGEHPVARFLHAILAHRDRAGFETICYSSAAVTDAWTARLRSLSDGWRDCHALNDEQLATQVRNDRTDVLIDLSLHMAESRLLAFARRPAPVQVTYLGYAGTSGMSAMGWRLSDPYLDPPGNDRFYTEQTVRLPRSYWCYSAPAASQFPLAPREQGPITFACLCAPKKMSDPALRSWAELLSRVPDSRLLIHAQPGRDRARVLGFFESAGVSSARVEFVEKKPLLEYLRLHRRVDIALDPFPYAGGTTTCDALWMGVPVVTLAGEIAVHRGGVSLLSNLALDELIAQNVEQYIGIAVELASSRAKLANLRATLRHRMESSILMNGSEFTRDFESALRQIWRRHAETGM